MGNLAPHRIRRFHARNVSRVIGAAARNASAEHPLERGKRVPVFRLFPRPMLEGWARIVNPVFEYPHLYEVRFGSARRDPLVRRFVHGGIWLNPDSILAQLIDHWRAEVATPEILIGFNLFEEEDES